MDNLYTFYGDALKALILDTLFALCQDDAKDAASYVYAFDRLMQAIDEMADKNEI